MEVNTRVVISETRIRQMLKSINKFIGLARTKTNTASDMAAERKRDVKIFVTDGIVGMDMRPDAKLEEGLDPGFRFSRQLEYEGLG